jgi:Ca-activated chloride channel family protein
MRIDTLLCSALMFLPVAASAAPPSGMREFHKTPFSPEAARAGVVLFEAEEGDEDEDDQGSWLAPQVSNEVEIRVTGLIARAQVAQTFENVSDEVVSAVYVFPLPETAAVDGITLDVGERRIVGEIKERAAAQATFDRAKAQGKKASLLEQERPNLFTTRVANIGPHETVAVHLTYQQDVHYDSGTFSLDFPSTLTPRYIPGQPTSERDPVLFRRSASAVPDVARITPPVTFEGDGPTLQLKLALEAGFSLKQVVSPSHEVVAVTRNSARGKVDVSLKDGLVNADRDFRLEWQPVRGSVPASTSFEEEFEGERYGLLLVLPPDPAADSSDRIARETTFIIDTSGSMSGTSIEQARAALESGLEALRPSDRFNVVAFDSTARQLFEGTVPASPEHVKKALGWVRRLQADGGTEMIPALELALGHGPDPEHVGQVVFVTDGSVGNEHDVFRFIEGHLATQRLFTVGIGSAPNQYFMRGAARFGRGTFTHVASTNEVAERMGELWSKLDTPLLGDLELGWKGSANVEAWPARLPDLYDGEPLVILAKLDAQTSGVSLSGKRAGQPFSSELTLAASSNKPGNTKSGTPKALERGIHKLWARRKIDGLMDQTIEGRSEEEVRPEVTALALHHHLLSKYTSLVAVDKTRSVEQPGPDVPVANELPAGNSMFGNMPQTATPGPTCLLLGALSLSAAWMTGKRARP